MSEETDPQFWYDYSRSVLVSDVTVSVLVAEDNVTVLVSGTTKPAGS